MRNITATAKKRIKDPVYGYIPIEVVYITDIVDTPVFQRLRRVIQTSYSPLYSSALHNRFVHSLGVFYLGSIAAKHLKKSIMEQNSIMAGEEEKGQIVEQMVHVYRLACLLHDVGHAPFSHTGEIYYKERGEDSFTSQKLHERLCQLVNSESLRADLPRETGSAAPHEIMSAIVGIKEFGELIGDKEFFARCITGYKYKARGPVNEVKNCFIGMLNSKVIDVDRLDYLIRDAYTSGFATVNIDYKRLLGALRVREYLDRMEVVYNKSAISVIENVVYAHDAEKKWIQNHPVVLYEAYIIKHMLEHISQNVDEGEKKLFSEESLSVDGNLLKGGLKLSLMCDDDIVFLSKNMFQDDLSREFFDRNKRRHPAWKSEAEYEAYIRGVGGEEDLKNLFKDCMDSFNASNIPDYPVPMVINDELLEKLRAENEKSMDSGSYEKGLGRKVLVCEYLKKYAQENKMPFDYIIIPTSIFSSNFSKDHLKNVLVDFDGRRPVKLGTVCRLLNSEKVAENEEFYYLFYRRGEQTESSAGRIDNVANFCRGLVDACLVNDKDK